MASQNLLFPFTTHQANAKHADCGSRVNERCAEDSKFVEATPHLKQGRGEGLRHSDDQREGPNGYA